MSELLKKYESIDQSKLSEATIKIIDRVKTITTNFTTEDEKNNKIAEQVLDTVIQKNPDAVKTAVVEKASENEPKENTISQKTHKATTSAKAKTATKAKTVAKPKKVTQPKQSATTSAPKGSSNNIMSIAKEIQKEGESWKDAIERAKVVLKEKKGEVIEKKKTELDKLLALVRTKKELQGFANSDIDRDSRRTALPRGRRVSENGNVYYENRENRTDRLAPNYPQDMPLLEKGGALSNNVLKEIYQAQEKSIKGGYFPEFKSEYKYILLVFGNHYGIKIENKHSEEFPAHIYIYDSNYKYLGGAESIKSKSKIEEYKLTEKDFEGTKFVGFKFAEGGSVKENLENRLTHYKNILINIDKYPDYNKKNVEKVISELEYQLEDNGMVKSVVDSIFEFNEKRGKLNTSFGAKTKEGITALIENDNYTSEEIAKAIFYPNVKKEYINTGWGQKTFFGLQDMIERARGKEYANGGSVKKVPAYAKKRLEELREVIREENMSYGEIAELETLKKYIDPNDVELLEWAGVPEFDEEDDDYAHGGSIKKVPANIKRRLEELRQEIREERISYGELAELQSLAEYIEPNDVELLEWAGVPEFDEEDDDYANGGELQFNPNAKEKYFDKNLKKEFEIEKESNYPNIYHVKWQDGKDSLYSKTNINFFISKGIWKKVDKRNNGGNIDSNNHSKEVNFLKAKGFSNIITSDKDSDVVFGEGDDVIFATQGQKNDDYAIAYFYTNEENGVSNISKEILRDIASQFRGSKVELFTNAGVDLHSTERNMYKNIIVRKVPYSNFEKYAEGGSLPFMTDPNFGDFQNTGSFADGGSIGSGKNGYVAFYKGKQIDVYADTKYEAQKLASQHFKAKKDYEVNVVLAELDGKPYVNSTSFADGGYFDKSEDVNFLFEVGEKIKIPQMEKGKIQLLDAEIIEQYPAEQNDGTYYPFYFVKGMWENSGKMVYSEEELLGCGNKAKNSFELGGAFMTDLAGHTGGSLGTGNPTPLSGFSGTNYTGLVGETGAMSSGELFENGGGIKMPDLEKRKKMVYSLSEEELKRWLSNNWGYRGFDGKAITRESNKRDVDNLRKEVLRQIDYNDKNIYEAGGAMAQNQQIINDASQPYMITESLGNPAQHFKKGGSIPNNYEGRTAENVWNNLTIEQRKHFISDHSGVIKYVKRNYKGIKDYHLITDEIKHQNSDWKNLDSDIKLIFKEHIEEGQYAYGGRTKSRPSMREIYIEELASMTRTRPIGVENFVDDNKLNDSELSNLTVGIGRGLISKADFITALVGEKNNSIQKEIIAFAKSGKAFKMAEGGDVLPPIKTYGENIREAMSKFDISDSEARKKYGQYTISEWADLLGRKYADGGEIEVVYDRKADFKKKPVRMVLLNKGNQQRGFTFSGKDQVDVLEKYNRNEQEDLEKLWNLKGYETKYADGGGIRSESELKKIISEKENLTKNLTAEQIAEIWNRNAGAVIKGIGKPMTLEEASRTNAKMYLTNLLIENELTEEEQSKYFENGGAFAPNVSNGTQFMNGVYANGGGVAKSGEYTGRIFNEGNEKKIVGKINKHDSLGNPIYDIHKYSSHDIKPYQNKEAELTEKEVIQKVEKYFNGGAFAPNVSNGTQFMNGVYANGGAINGELNKKIKALAEKMDLTMDELGRDEYNKVMTQALRESLTDANFHEEAREVVSKAENKEWSDELYKSVYFNPSPRVDDFARKVATECSWELDDILNAYYFVTKMEGSKVGDMIDNLFFKPKAKKNIFSANVKFNVGDIVWDKGNESYGTVMNNYGDPINGDGGEIRLDSDGNQSIFTYDKDYENTGYNLIKLGEKGDEGNFNKVILNEMKASAKHLIDSRKERKDKEMIEYYEGIYKRLLDGEFDSMADVKTSSSSSKIKKYVDHADIEKVTVKYKGKEVSFKGDDVLNGANILADGGDLSKIAFYIPKRDVIDVTLKYGSKIKPANGYWIKKGAEPISTPTATPKKTSTSGARFKFDIGDKVMINDSGYVTSFSEFDLSKPAEIIDRSTSKMGGKTYYFYKVKMADGRVAFNQAEQSKLSLAEKGSFADGGGVSSKLEKGIYRLGKPIKVSPILYEQKIVEVFDNCNISTASDYGRNLDDFKSQKYPIITEEQLEVQYKMAEGGMFETPIGIQREVKGKLISVPVSDEISKSEVDEFVDYVYRAYQEDGVYQFTKAQVRKAVNKYLTQLEFEHTWGGGDSLDRERVYEFLTNPNLKEIKNPSFANGGAMFDDNDGFMKADNNFNYRYPQKEVIGDTIDEPIDLTDNYSYKPNEVVINPINGEIDLTSENLRAKIGYYPKNRNAEKMRAVNPRMTLIDLPKTDSNTHRNND